MSVVTEQRWDEEKSLAVWKLLLTHLGDNTNKEGVMMLTPEQREEHWRKELDLASKVYTESKEDSWEEEKALAMMTMATDKIFQLQHADLTK